MLKCTLWFLLALLYSCHWSSTFPCLSCMSAHLQGLSKRHQVLVWALSWASFSSVECCVTRQELWGLRMEQLKRRAAWHHCNWQKGSCWSMKSKQMYHKSQDKIIGCFYCWCYFGCFTSTKLFSQYYVDDASCYCKVNLSTGSWLLHWGTCSVIWKPSNFRFKAATLWIPFEVPWNQNKYHDFVLLFWFCELCQSSEFQKCIGL